MNEYLKAAFIAAENEAIGETDVTKAWEPSEKFKANIEKLIKKRKKWYWGLTNSRPKRVGLIIAVVIALLAVSCGIAYETIGCFLIKNENEDFASIFYDMSDGYEWKQTIEREYRLAEIPEGFVKEIPIVDEYAIMNSYINSNDIISFNQYLVFPGSDSAFDNEHGGYKAVDIFGDDKAILFYTSDDHICLKFRYDGYAFFIMYPPIVNEEELIKIAESIIPADSVPEDVKSTVNESSNIQ